MLVFECADQMAPRWTQQQIKGMLTHLKHRGKCTFHATRLDHADSCCTGLSSFVKEYVITRAIPIPELLCAFDVYLVGRCKLTVYSNLMLLVSVKNCKRGSRQPWYIFSKSSFRESKN